MDNIKSEEWSEAGYKHCCVVDDGKYVDFVLVKEMKNRDTGEIKQEIDSYVLGENQQLVESNPPTMRIHAGTNGFIKPLWSNKEKAWVESSTKEEIAEWESKNPAPVPEPEPQPTEIEVLQDEVTDLQLALVEQYEKNLALEEEVTNTQLALVELYEGGVA